MYMYSTTVHAVKCETKTNCIILIFSLYLFNTQFTVNQKQYKYVVAQGPLEHTCADFWQMVWEQKIHFLIMVTNEVVSVTIVSIRL